MPKKSIDKNPISIVSSQGTDGSGSDTTLISGLDVSVSASDVISSNLLGGYLGDNVQLNLDDLTSDAIEGQPPKIGFEPISFSNGSVSAIHDGRPDWGQAKVVDNPPWLTRNKKWADKFEMPHYYSGMHSDNPFINQNIYPKWINEEGIYDTVNINYRDLNDNSDHGINDTPPGTSAYKFNNFPVPMQSVPRSSFNLLNPYDVYPYLYSEPFVYDDVNDFFNASTDTTLGLNAGMGTSSLGVKNGQASINLGSPLRTTTYSPNITASLTDPDTQAPPFDNPEPPTRDVGIVLSGLLFPADRGVVALIRFPSDANGVATSFVGTPATTIEDIEKRVIAAINLGQGAGINDGEPGGAIFNNSPNESFPSRKAGQYDLYELHTGNHTSESTRSGTLIADLVGVPNREKIGKVRLLSEPNAFDGTLTREGGIPVLFSPFEKIARPSNNPSISWSSFYELGEDPVFNLGAYVIDNLGNTPEATIDVQNEVIEITAPSGETPYTYYAYVKIENRNFLSYRLPVLKDYSPKGLKTPPSERDRFFIKRKPNNDQDLPEYNPILSSAGGYITFGNQDNFSFQVARYRQVITLTRDYLFYSDSLAAMDGLSLDASEPEYNFGSLALIHFKTERAFEALVRDGIAPSKEDIYSKNLLDYTNLNKNVGLELGTSGDDGLDDGVSSFSKENSMSVFRPNLNFMQKIKAYPKSITIKSSVNSEGLHYATPHSSLERTNTYFMWTSGVIYVNPSIWLANEHSHRSRPGVGGVYRNSLDDLNYSRFQMTVRIEPKDPQGSDLVSEWDKSNPTTAKPFTTVRPTYQILASGATVADNLVADDYWNYNSPTNTSPVYETQSKRQQIWANSSELTPTLQPPYIIISVRPKGDAVKPISDLTQYNPKDGLCTFSTNGLRPSVIVNNPHRQFENLGVHHIKDDLGDNSTSSIKKLLYHSARKISLLELYGERLNPSGFKTNKKTSISVNDIYTPTEKNAFGTHRTNDITGNNYRSNTNFFEMYLRVDWTNTNPLTQGMNPKTAGQAFSIYRYDDEGYKVYVELDLLPIGGDENNGYALELCSGWPWVDDNDDNVLTVAEFLYKKDVPVYRPVENNHSRTTATTHWDAKFLGVIGNLYYIECHPSIPYNYITNNLGVPLISGANPLTASKSSIFQLGNADATADLGLFLDHSIAGDVPPVVSVIRREIYKFLGSGHYNNVSQAPADILYGEPLPGAFTVVGNSPNITGGGVFSAETGATVHLARFYVTQPTSPATGATSPVFFSSKQVHPQFRESITEGGLRNFGHSIMEVKPTGNRELPEYGNFTMDHTGFITVSGMGSSDFGTSSHLYATNANIDRSPLISLFTPRKDTQERFLDESYRIEHSLRYLLRNDDPDSNYQYGNHANISTNPPTQGNIELRTNLIGPGIPHFGSGVNGGYISFPVRDEDLLTPYGFYFWNAYAADGGLAPKGWNRSVFGTLSFHGFAGYLRNSHHMKRITISNPLGANDWLEAQVSGFPNMTRNHLSGAKYGTPPRGVLIYPYQDFNGETTQSHGYDLSNSSAGTVNPLLDSETGFFLPNSNGAIPQNINHIDSDIHGIGNPTTWIDDDADDGGTAQHPRLRYAQPDYSGVDNTYPDVGYLRAFDLNFGKSKERTPHLPYWKMDWVEQTTDGKLIDRNANSADEEGLIESEKWKRHSINSDGSVSFTPIKLRLVGIDWDMISYVNPNFPNARKDGLVYTIDNKKYLMRKRVMRIFVKVPGLTTWLDVGVMNGEVGESYAQYTGDPTGTFGGMNENGATSDKTHRSIDGAGCCVSYKETFLVEEGLVALDLELDVGFVPAFNTLGTENFLGDADSEKWLGSKDTIVQEDKVIWVGNSQRHYGDNIFRNWGAGNKEAPILVKVVLSPPEYPKYERHPDNGTRLVERDDPDSTNLLETDLNNSTPNNETIYDIWSAPNKSYRGHSFPPDDRAPTWARRGLMGIEVLRPDGTNYDRDEVIDRPDFTKTELFGENETLYMAYLNTETTGVTYLKTTSEYTNKVSYTINDSYNIQANAEPTLISKGEG